MEKRTYYRQLSPWWECIETEADNFRINPKIFKCNDFVPAGPVSLEQNNKDCLENCYVFKEAFQKFLQFLTSSHQSGCSEKSCKFNPKAYKIKLSVKNPSDTNPNGQTQEIRLKKKRGRKSKYEIQQLALMQASNGLKVLNY